jgi:sarcosine oxidase gamma subunit
MSIEITGTIKSIDLGPGSWSVITESGEKYELMQPIAKDLKQAGAKVKLKGKVRDDVMTLAMSGPVLEVQEYHFLK